MATDYSHAGRRRTPDPVACGLSPAPPARLSPRFAFAFIRAADYTVFLEKIEIVNLTNTLPDGLRLREMGNRAIIALPEYMDVLAACEPAGLPEAGRGRAAIRRLELPSGRKLLVRQYHRGGVLRAINNSRYLSPRRAIDEIRVCREAAARGVPVAVAAGAIVERQPPFWLCWLVTEEIEEAVDLGEYLRWLPAAPTREILAEKRDIIDVLGAAIRAMHDAGLCHADLQARNVLIRRSPARIEVFFVDLDKSTITGSLGESRRADNLRRLNRSILKMRLSPPPIDDDDRRRFLAAYRGGRPIFGDDVDGFLKTCRRHAAIHSIAWRIFK